LGLSLRLPPFATLLDYAAVAAIWYDNTFKELSRLQDLFERKENQLRQHILGATLSRHLLNMEAPSS
jgi:hypothetical protein